ncbi:MAG: FG-GAP repeat domain-containing protein [Pirellulales bacterium]
MWFRSILNSTNSAAAGASRRSKKRPSPRRRAAQRPRLEGLEMRCLLSFSAPVDYAAGQFPASVVAADFANNGIQDLVVANRGYFNGYTMTKANTISVLPGNGDGTFGAPEAYPTGASPISVAVGDLTGNGKLNIVTGNNPYSPYSGSNAGSVSVLLGNGDGTFQPATTFDLPGVFPPGYTGTTPLTQEVSSIAVGDMNHDGHPDVVVTAGAGNSSDYIIDVLLGNGRGGFSVATITTLPNGIQPTSVKLADLGNGNLDVAAASGSSVAVLLGNGDGTFGAPTSFADPTAGDLAVGDVNGDGKLDLVTSGPAGVSVLLGNGDGTFQAAKYTALPPPSNGGSLSAGALVMGDLNADGKLDLAVTATYEYLGSGGYDYSGANVDVLLGNGDGTFTAAQTIPGVSGFSITAADFNGDAFPDLAITGGVIDGRVSVLLNGANWAPPAPAPSSFALSGFPASTTAGTPGSITVAALNADGTIDTGYTGTVRFSSSDGQAALPANYTFTSSDAGQHTFSATL